MIVVSFVWRLSVYLWFSGKSSNTFLSHPVPVLLGIVDEVVEPPEVVVPVLGQDNSITFVVQTYKIDEVKYLTS